MKTCTKCHKELDESHFGLRTTGKPHTHCKACRTAYAVAYNERKRKENPEAHRKANIEYQKRVREMRKAGLLPPLPKRVSKPIPPEVIKERDRKARETSPIQWMLYRAKSRAKQFGFEFSITEADVVKVDVCPVFGFPLDWSATKAQFNSPSLDRFDSSKGYVPGNVNIISWRANSLKSDGSLEEFKKLVEWMASCS